MTIDAKVTQYCGKTSIKKSKVHRQSQGGGKKRMHGRAEHARPEGRGRLGKTLIQQRDPIPFGYSILPLHNAAKKKIMQRSPWVERKKQGTLPSLPARVVERGTN